MTVALDDPEDLFLPFGRCMDFAPSLLKLKQPVIGRIVKGSDPIRDSPLFERRFEDLGFDKVFDIGNLYICHKRIRAGDLHPVY